MFCANYIHCKVYNYNVSIFVGFDLLPSLITLFEGKSLSLPATSCAATLSSGDTPQHPEQSKSAYEFFTANAENSRRKRDFRSGLWPFTSPPPNRLHPTAPEGNRHKPRESQILRVPLAGTASGDFISLPSAPPLPPLASLAACPPAAHNSSGSVASSDAIRIFQQGQVHGHSPFVPILAILASALHVQSGHLTAVVKDLHRYACVPPGLLPLPFRCACAAAGCSGFHPVLPDCRMARTSLSICFVRKSCPLVAFAPIQIPLVLFIVDTSTF